MRAIDADALKDYIDAQEGRPFIGCTVGEALKIMTDEQPTIQPESHWIPVTERLPEDVEEGQEYPTVIYSTNSGEVAAGWYETLTRTWWRESISDDVIKDKVIAWCELPEPYKEVTE